MLRKENLPAFTLVWLMFSIVVGYAFAQFLAPGETEVTSGVLGFGTDMTPVFNWRAFLTGFCLVQSVVPLVHLVHRQWIWGGVEILLIVLTGFLGSRLSASRFTIAESDSGLLGFNELTTLSFRTDLLLLTVVLIWALASLVRMVVDQRDKENHWVKSPSLRLALALLAWASAGCYFIGIHTPVFHSVKFWLFEDQVSLVQSIDAFFQSNEVFIGLVVLTFTLIFPVIKIAYMFWALLSVPSPLAIRVNKVLAILGKYSMLDVFVIALLLLNLKFDSQLIDMELQDGVVWFTISILLNMGVTSFLVLRKAPPAVDQAG